MDLLFQRYANPFFVLDSVIPCNRFAEFISELLKKNNKEIEEKTLWELWLNRGYGQSFDEFKGDVIQEEPEQVSQEELEATVIDSRDLLDGFIPT